MARLPDLVEFAQAHDLKIGAIADLIAWRRMNETLVTRVTETAIETEFGGSWRLIIYRNDVTDVEHIVLQKGEILPDIAVMVRMHALDLMVDLFGRSHRSRSHGELATCNEKDSRGGYRRYRAFVRPAPPAFLKWSINRRARIQMPKSRNCVTTGVGAQILNDLNITNMVLLTNSKPNVIGLEGYGLHIDGWHPVSDVTEEHKG